jgi:hypothetical protein
VRAIFLWAAFLVSILSCACLIGRSQTKENLAKVSFLKIDQEKVLSLQPLSEVGIILLALDTCSIKVNGQPVELRSGERKFLHGRRTVILAPFGSGSVSLVAVNIVTAAQALTFDSLEILPRKELEDGSDRNDTLLVALAPLKLREVRDLSDEDEPWKSGPPRMIELEKGQFTWLKPGVHRLRNTGNSAARFVTIEWGAMISCCASSRPAPGR